MDGFKAPAHPMAGRRGGEPDVAVGRSFRDPEDRIDWLEEMSAARAGDDRLRGTRPALVLEGYLMAEVLGCSFQEIPAAGLISTLEGAERFVNRALAEFLAAIRNVVTARQ